MDMPRVPRANGTLDWAHRDSTHYDLPLVPGPNAAGFDYFFGIPSSLDFAPYVFVAKHGLRSPAH